MHTANCFWRCENGPNLSSRHETTSIEGLGSVSCCFPGRHKKMMCANQDGRYAAAMLAYQLHGQDQFVCALQKANLSSVPHRNWLCSGDSDRQLLPKHGQIIGNEGLLYGLSHTSMLTACSVCGQTVCQRHRQLRQHRVKHQLRQLDIPETGNAVIMI